MEPTVFSNDVILTWLHYFSQNVDLDLAKLQILDITGPNKNLIPAIASHRAVLVFTDAGHPDIFYDMWNAELGGCDIWYNEGSNPTGPVKHDKLSDMINRGINASAAMLIVNPNPHTNVHVGLENSRFSCGSVRYCCREVRAVIMNKLDLADQDNVCIVSSESIAVEAAMIANEGHVIAVEYDAQDRETMKDNIARFGLHNVTVTHSLEDDALASISAPDIGFLVASPKLGAEVKKLISMNPNMRIAVYTLNFDLLNALPAIFSENGLERTEAVRIEVLRVNSKSMVEPFPAPWIITGQRPE